MVLSVGCAVPFIKLETVLKQVVDPASYKRTLNYDNLANHTLHTSFCLDVFEDFCTFPSSECNAQQEQTHIYCRCEVRLV